MNFIRKILKQNLVKLDATDDIILSVTEDFQLFVNMKNGEHKKISDIVTVATEEELAGITPIVGKMYYVVASNDIKYYRGGQTDPFISFKHEMATQISTMSNTIATLTQTLTELQAAVTQGDNANATALTNAIATINASIQGVTTNINTLTGTVTALGDRVTVTENNIVSLTNSINTINQSLIHIDEAIVTSSNAIATIQQSITTINNTVSGHTSSIATLDQDMLAVKEDIIAINQVNATQTSDIASIKTSIGTKKYNAVYSADTLIVTDLEPDLYIPAYIFGANQKLFVDKMTLTTKVACPNTITFNVSYLAYNPDGSLAAPVVIDTLTLPINTYSVSKVITTTGYSNGLIRVSVTDSGQGHSDATCIVGVSVKEIAP